MKVYAIKNKDNDIRKESSSGGVFSLIASCFLQNGGVVYGASFDNEFVVKHTRICRVDDLYKLRGSKYVQSKMGDTYKNVVFDLKNGKSVLFSGTPCQVQGLKMLVLQLGLDTGLYVVDIVCHGVPSPKIFKEYLDYKTRIENKSIKEINFRNKKFKWKECRATIRFNKDSKIINMSEWTRLFYGHEILRKSCYCCKFTNLNRTGDITLGDFWGIERSNPSFYDDMGVSLCLINSEKGEELFSKISANCYWVEEQIEHTEQPQLYKPVRVPVLRKVFWWIYDKKGADYIFKTLANNKGIYSAIARLLLNIKKNIKKVFVLLNIKEGECYESKKTNKSQ